MLQVTRLWMGVGGDEDQDVGIYVAAIPELLDRVHDVGPLTCSLELE